MITSTEAADDGDHHGVVVADRTWRAPPFDRLEHHQCGDHDQRRALLYPRSTS
ncbi:MAG TPA: hypothetical protein VFP92_08355 [Rhodanobacteraceae bacterium]|nr:hypothetical protein [Rhodanobacteraceae bacterium]